VELSNAVRQYLNAMTAQGNSRYTIRGAKSALKELVSFLKAIEVVRIEQLDTQALMQYREELSWRLTRFNTPLSPRSQSELLGHLRAFCRWMVAQDWLVADPSKKIPNPKKPQQLPKSILEPREIDKILTQPDMSTARGYRDRVILEVLYATAMRREEVANLLLEDIDTESGYAVIRQGKGGKDRVVPIGVQVCELIDTYVAGVRTDWINIANDTHLFLNRFGYGMDPNAIYHVVLKHARAAQLKKPVSTHTFRHSCATHMLKNGAPIRHIQELLGHASLETTQVYTRITINDLKAIHKRFHPREQQEIAK
jgi:integrase/recombinase XerD